MNEINEFWPRLFMGCGALITGLMLLSLIRQYKEKFQDQPLVVIDSEEKQ